MFSPITTHAEVRAILQYIPTTGVLLWSQPRGRVLKGSIAGTTIKGIRYVRVAGLLMKASDVIHFWMTGEWLQTRVKDGDGCNLLWENIETTPEEKDQSNTESAYTYIRLNNEGTWEVAGNMGATIASIAPITGDTEVKFVQAVFSGGKWLLVSNGVPQQLVDTLKLKLDTI